jgi:hypothetical protein
MYTQDTIVDVWPFTRQRDGDELIIGRPDTGAFLAVSPEAVELLDRLAQGWSVGEVAAQAQSEVSDLDGFLSSLEIEGLVKPRGANGDINALPTKTPPVLRYHFSAFPQKLAQRIYSRPALAACFLLIGLASGALIYDPSLWPRGLDLFFTSHKTVMLTILLIVSFGSVVIHESSHVIAARAQGVNSRLGLGNRLWAFVVEADLTGLWSIPRRQRYLPMMAGSLFDAVMSSGLILVLLAHNHALVVMSPITVQLLRAILLTYMTRIMWQTLLFVRTDYYYVIATFFNCRNLMGDTEDYLRNQLARFISRIRPVDQSTIPASERRVVMMYVFVWILGRIIALTFLFEVTIPLVRHYIGNVAHALSVGYSANHRDFIDSFLMSFLFGIPFAIGMLMWLTSIVRRIARAV